MPNAAIFASASTTNTMLKTTVPYWRASRGITGAVSSVGLCMYMYVCMYVCMYSCVYIYTYMYVCVFFERRLVEISTKLRYCMHA